MAWTYTPDFTLPRDQVRFLVQDTQSTRPLLTDAEIAWVISTEANVYMAADPVQTATLPLGTPDAQQKVEQPISSTPLGFGTYEAKLQAVAATGEVSEWSAASNPFTRVPFPPTALAVTEVTPNTGDITVTMDPLGWFYTQQHA